MKKFISFFVVCLVAVLPFSVKALKVQNPVSCTATNDNGERTCTISADFEGTPASNITITLAEQGGADIISVDSTDWVVTSSQNADASVWTVSLTGPGVSGESTLIKFTYKVSGEENCAINVGIDGVSASTPVTNKTTENKQTGATIPFVALGSLAVFAGVAYVLTKNKAKMYNI